MILTAISDSHSSMIMANFLPCSPKYRTNTVWALSSKWDFSTNRNDFVPFTGEVAGERSSKLQSSAAARIRMVLVCRLCEHISFLQCRLRVDSMFDGKPGARANHLLSR